MEVINGTFGQEKESSLTLQEALTEGLSKAGVSDATGMRFFLMIDSDEFTTFITNEGAPAEIVLMLEIAKTAIVSSV